MVCAILTKALGGGRRRDGGRYPRRPSERAWSRGTCPSAEHLCPADPRPTPRDPPQRAGPDLLLQPDLGLPLNLGLCWSLLLVQPEDTWLQGGFPAGTSQGSWCLTSGLPGWHRKDSSAQASSTQRPSTDQTWCLAGITAVEDGDGVGGREGVSSGAEGWEGRPVQGEAGSTPQCTLLVSARLSGTGPCRRGLATPPPAPRASSQGWLLLIPLLP